MTYLQGDVRPEKSNWYTSCCHDLRCGNCLVETVILLNLHSHSAHGVEHLLGQLRKLHLQAPAVLYSIPSATTKAICTTTQLASVPSPYCCCISTSSLDREQQAGLDAVELLLLSLYSVHSTVSKLTNMISPLA